MPPGSLTAYFHATTLPLRKYFTWREVLCERLMQPLVCGAACGRQVRRLAGAWRLRAVPRPVHVTENRSGPPPLAAAMEWVAKITTVALEMFLPAIGGRYLDGRFGTQYWVLVGLVLGFVVGMWHLLQMTRATDRGGRSNGEGTSGGSSDN